MFYFGMSNEPDAIPAQMCGLWQLESTCTRAASELPLNLGSELRQVGRSVGVTVMEGDEEVEEKEGEQGPVSGGRPPARTVVGSNLGSTPIPSEASRVASSNGSRRRCCKPVGGAACRMDAIFARRLMQPPRPLAASVLPCWRCSPTFAQQGCRRSWQMQPCTWLLFEG